MCNSEQRELPSAGKLIRPVSDQDEFRRLMLQIERAVLARAGQRTLLAAADANIASQRQQLRSLKARMARRRSPGRGQDQ